MSVSWAQWWPGRLGGRASVGSQASQRLYFGYLIILCAAFAASSAVSAAGISGVLATVPSGFWVLAGLAVIVDTPLFTLGRLGRQTIFASVSFTFAMSYGWGHGTGRVAQTAAILVSAVLSRREVWAVIFDVGRYGLALSAVGLVGVMAGRTYPVAPDLSHLAFMLAAAAVWYLIFRLATGTEVWLREGGRWTRALLSGIRAEALAAGALLLLSPMLIAIMQVNAWLIPLVLVPLYAVSTMSRLWYEQSQRYLVDSLTGLANRAGLARETGRVVAANERRRGADRAGEMAALLVVDLDDFRLINEVLGYVVADRVLISVAQRLGRLAGPDLVVARLSGDEFGVLLSGLADEQEVRARAGLIRDQFGETIAVEGEPLTVDASVGVAIYPFHGADFDTLARHADLAMQHAKELPGRIAVFQPEAADSLGPQRWALLGELRRVLEQPGSHEIVPYYQPEVDLATGAIVGVEALMRWSHPVRGMVSPEEVVRAAEHSPVMQQITRRMIGQVLEQLSRWHSSEFNVRASVNVSVRDLYDEDFVPWLRQQLRRYGVTPGDLQLEITETALMTLPANVLSSLQSLRQLGVGAALDDFGTGFSSLEHVRRLPLTEVKIDRSFTQSMVDDAGAEAVIRAIIDLADDLGLRVVAEGVEDERTRQRLLADGCHFAQGWYYVKALPVEGFDRWRTHQASA
jgi:diguanylate cyclase (GGDEF)-like protein